MQRLMSEIEDEEASCYMIVKSTLRGVYGMA
jgi:hypothetical protein